MSNDNPMNKIKTWQQGQFVDSAQYNNWSQPEKDDANYEESHKVTSEPGGFPICRCALSSNAAWIAERLNLAAKLEEENAILKKGIAAVRSLIEESDGVSGLHLNGDMADWDSLCEGGRFEAWLFDFNAAEEIVSTEQELTAPDYNGTLKAIADLGVFDNE